MCCVLLERQPDMAVGDRHRQRTFGSARAAFVPNLTSLFARSADGEWRGVTHLISLSCSY